MAIFIEHRSIENFEPYGHRVLPSTTMPYCAHSHTHGTESLTLESAPES